MKLPAGYVAGQGVVKPTGYGGFGERMLRDMGWHAGDGLGKARQGMKQAIEVKKKEDTAGVRALHSIHPSTLALLVQHQCGCCNSLLPAPPPL